MTSINIAPVIQPTISAPRSAFTSPTGVYYMVGTPSVSLAEVLIESGIIRVVFSAQIARPDWFDAQELLLRSGVEVTGTFQKD